MSANFDAAVAELAKLTAAIKERNTKPESKPETAWDDVKRDFDTEIATLVAAQVKERMDAQPQRRLAGDAIPGGVTPQPQLAGNRYAAMLRDFDRDGIHKQAGQVNKAVDLLITGLIMAVQEKNHRVGLADAGQAGSADLRAAIKAMTSTGAGTGLEIVPYDMQRQLWEDIFLASRIVPNLQRITMPTNPFDIPLALGQPVWRTGTQNTATTVSDLATAKTTMTSTELVTEQDWSYTLDEDAAVAMAPAIRARLAQSGAEIIDAFALNADSTVAATGTINSDDGTPPAGSYYLTAGQDGLRHAWLIDNTAMGIDCAGALTDAKITAALALMGKYAIDPNNLLMICDAGTYLSGFLATGTGSPGDNLITIDKFGSSALILTGQVASYRGIPIIVSASSPRTLATGKTSVTPASNVKGSITFVNRSMWYVGFRRDLLIEADRDITKRMNILVTSVREALAAFGTRSTQTHTAGLRNIT